MPTHDPSRSQPQRRLVLRKIAAPGRLPTVPPPPNGGPTVRTPLPVLAAEVDGLVLPKPTRPITAPAPLPVPATQSAHTSVPPVVATVITPLPTMLDAPGQPRVASSWKGVIGGTVLGLAVVGAIVVGARLSQSPHGTTSAAAAPAAPPPAVAILPAAATVAIQSTQTPAVAVAKEPPVIAATALPLAPPPVRWNPPVTAARNGAPKASVIAAQSTPAAMAPTPAASVAQPEPTPEDNTAALIPVIPTSAPPAVDPLVKAVKDDIDEEVQARGK